MNEIGERRMIEMLCRGLPSTPDVIIGPGDDCAVVRPAETSEFDWLLKSDPVIEGVHFTQADNAVAVGHKALGRVLSDIAAMGGEPRWINVNITALPDIPTRRLKDFYRGIKKLAIKYNIAVTGGDISAAPTTSLHIFGVGRIPRGQAVLRAGARPGDLICVTGRLGGSRAGRHLNFEPRLKEGQWLRAGKWATAMIDISDGLSTDLQHITRASRTGAELEAATLPLGSAAHNAADGRSALDHALHDGEDFELLFTLPAAGRQEFQRAWNTQFKLKCTVIGRITPYRQGLRIRHPAGTVEPLPARGYEHFENMSTNWTHRSGCGHRIG